MVGRPTGRKDSIGITVCSIGYGLYPLAILAARILFLDLLDRFIDIFKQFLLFILVC